MHLIYLGESRMSDSSSGKEEENESLSDGWTFVDDDESAGNGQSNEDNGEEKNESVSKGWSPVDEEDYLKNTLNSQDNNEEENESLSGCWSAFDDDDELKYNLYSRVENESHSSGWSAFEDSENDLHLQDNNEDHEGGVTPPPEEEEEEVEVEVEVTEEEEEEDDITKGQQVQEVKVISGTESSDIETIEYPQVQELRELYVSQIPSNQGMRDSFNSFFSRGTPYSDYTVDADTESLSSEGSPEEKIRRRRTRKPEAIQDEETDLSLASSPSLPDDLPAIKPDPQYVHTPRPEINYRLNLIVGITVVLVLGLGVGHFLGIIDLSEDVEPGWSRRSLWDENLNAAQILENLKLENEELQDRVSELQAEHTEPFKIKGKDGKEARSLRERINHLIAENEDMRLALSRYQYSGLPDADKGEFNKVSQENQHLRKTVLQLTHLVPDNGKLEVSLQYFKDQHQDLLRKVGKIRHEQPLPKELTPMIKQLEEMRSVVAQEAKKKNPPSSIANARSYLTYMGQVFSQFTYLHDWEEKSAAEKIDLAKDIFAYWLPKGVKLSPKMQDDMVKTRSHFNTIKSSIRKKWKQLKDFTNPDTIVTVGQSTVGKMNRVIVNVVNKMKDIGQTTIMSTNKQLEHSIYALSQGLAKLNKQFDETWKSLEIRIAMSEKYDFDANEDDDESNDNDDDDDDDDNNDNDDEEDVIGNYIKSSTNDEEEFVNENVEVKHKSQVPDIDKKPDVEEKPNLDSHKIKEEVQKQIMDKEIEKIKGKDYHKKEPYHDKRKEHGKDRKVDVKEKKKYPPAKFAKPYEKEVPKAKGGEWHKEEKKDTFVKEDKKEEKKSLADKIKEKQEEKQTKEDSRYFKGQYNKFDKVKEDSAKPASDSSRKQQKRKDNNDDDDEDEVGDTKKATGLKRHWEKPQKKNYFREQSGPKKQFIRRRGKEDEGPTRDKKDVREKKQDKKRLDTKEGREWNKKDDKRNKDNRDDKQNKGNKNDRRNIDNKDDRRNKYNKDDRPNKNNKDDRPNKNNKDDRRNKDNKEHKNKSKDKWNYKNNDLNSKYLKREGKHGIKVGFDFKKGMYRNREKYVPKSHEIKFLKTSPDLVVPPRYNVQQLRHKDN